VERLINWIEEYKIDGVVMHEAFSCRHGTSASSGSYINSLRSTNPFRSWWFGQDGKKEKVFRELPSLILESDIIDITSYSEVDTRNKIDAFIDTLESIRVNRAA